MRRRKAKEGGERGEGRIGSECHSEGMFLGGICWFRLRYHRLSVFVYLELRKTGFDRSKSVLMRIELIPDSFQLLCLPVLSNYYNIFISMIFSSLVSPPLASASAHAQTHSGPQFPSRSEDMPSNLSVEKKKEEKKNRHPTFRYIFPFLQNDERQPFHPSRAPPPPSHKIKTRISPGVLMR